MKKYKLLIYADASFVNDENNIKLLKKLANNKATIKLFKTKLYTSEDTSLDQFKKNSFISKQVIRALRQADVIIINGLENIWLTDYLQNRSYAVGIISNENTNDRCYYHSAYHLSRKFDYIITTDIGYYEKVKGYTPIPCDFINTDNNDLEIEQSLSSLCQRFYGFLVKRNGDSWPRKIIGRVFDTNKLIRLKHLRWATKQGLIFYFANHILPIIPFYHFRYWFYRKFCKYKIGRRTSISPSTFFTGNNFSIGNNSVINRQCYIDAREEIIIGNNVNISNQCYIQTAQHNPRSSDFKYIPGPVQIHDHVWIGARTIILPGVTIGEGAVVGAGAVVNKNIPPYTIAVGVPATVVGERPKNLTYRTDYFPFFDTDYAPYY